MYAVGVVLHSARCDSNLVVPFSTHPMHVTVLLLAGFRLLNVGQSGIASRACVCMIHADVWPFNELGHPLPAGTRVDYGL